MGSALVAWSPSKALAEEDAVLLRNGKSFSRTPSSELAAPDTPHLHLKQRKAPSSLCYLLDLPCELQEHLVVSTELDFKDLCALGSSCTRLRELTTESCQAHWRALYAERWEITELQQEAAKLAGGWKGLFAARHVVDKEAHPWQKPCRFEVEASVRRLAGEPSGEEAGPNSELCIVFLVDGSGSVTEDDFSCMQEFMGTALTSIAAMGRPSMVSVLQFSNDCRVEMSPQPTDTEAFHQLMANMHRMNGGTNISLAVQKAGQLLKPLGDDTRRVLVLLTDGRVDSHQAREAHDMARRLADEQPHVELYAFGVGRGVDRQELVHIISANDPESAEGRYMALCTLDEAPW